MQEKMVIFFGTAMALCWAASTAQAGSPSLDDLLDIQIIDGQFSGGSPSALLNVDAAIVFSPSAPPGYWVENLGLELFTTASSHDLGLGDLQDFSPPAIASFIDVFETLHPEVDASIAWIIDPGGATPPTFEVDYMTDFSTPVSVFMPGDSPLGLTIDISSLDDIGDGVAGFRFTGTVVPAPSSAALLLAGAVLGRRRRQQA